MEETRQHHQSHIRVAGRPRPQEHDLECPECGAKMVLRDSRYGWFYGCSTFPKCPATHGTHPNGEPLGIPANKETKSWRMKAHFAFDTLWNDPTSTMSRSEAYRWMSETLALDSSDAHISMFGIDRCKQLIEAIRVKDELAEINDCVDWETVRARRMEKRRDRRR